MQLTHSDLYSVAFGLLGPFSSSSDSAQGIEERIQQGADQFLHGGEKAGKRLVRRGGKSMFFQVGTHLQCTAVDEE